MSFIFRFTAKRRILDHNQWMKSTSMLFPLGVVRLSVAPMMDWIDM